MSENGVQKLSRTRKKNLHRSRSLCTDVKMTKEFPSSHSQCSGVKMTQENISLRYGSVMENSHSDGDNTMYEVTELLLASNWKLEKKVRYLEAELRSLKVENRTGCDYCCAQEVAKKVSVTSEGMRRNCDYLDKELYVKQSFERGRNAQSKKPFAKACWKQDLELDSMQGNISKSCIQLENKTCTEDKSQNSSKLKACQFCGTIHIWGIERCPAYGNMCNMCWKDNHF